MILHHYRPSPEVGDVGPAQPPSATNRVSAGLKLPDVARRIEARARATRRDRRQSVRRLVERVAKWAGDEADKAARQRSLTTSPRGSPR